MLKKKERQKKGKNSTSWKKYKELGHSGFSGSLEFFWKCIIWLNFPLILNVRGSYITKKPFFVAV